MNTQAKAVKRLRRKRRIRGKISGSASIPRLSIYKSNSHVYIQAIDDLAGVTLASSSTLEKDNRSLTNNVDDASKIGEQFGKKLLEKKVKEAVFDRNGYPYRGVVKAVAEGIRKAGVKL